VVNDLEPAIYVIDRRGLEATVIIIVVVVVVTGQQPTFRDYFINNSILIYYNVGTTYFSNMISIIGYGNYVNIVNISCG